MLQWRTRHAVLITLVVLASVIASLGGLFEDLGLCQFNW
jgi:hypothetical protein